MKYARLKVRKNGVITLEKMMVLQINKRIEETVLTEGKDIEELFQMVKSEKNLRGINVTLIERVLGIDLVRKNKKSSSYTNSFSTDSKYLWFNKDRKVKIALNYGEKILNGNTIGIVEDKLNKLVVVVKDGKGVGVVKGIKYGSNSKINFLDLVGYELAKMGLFSVNIWYLEI